MNLIQFQIYGMVPFATLDKLAKSDRAGNVVFLAISDHICTTIEVAEAESESLIRDLNLWYPTVEFTYTSCDLL